MNYSGETKIRVKSKGEIIKDKKTMHNSSKERNEEGKYMMIGGVVVSLFIIAGIALLCVFIYSLHFSNDPWWGQGKTERLTVKQCKNDDCSEVSFSEKRYVTYVGEIQLGKNGNHPVMDSEEKNKIINLIDEDIVNDWRKTVGLDTELTKDQMLNQIKIFKMSSGASSVKQLYGFCRRDHAQKNCIAFESASYYLNGEYLGFDIKEQYRFIGD